MFLNSTVSANVLENFFNVLEFCSMFLNFQKNIANNIRGVPLNRHRQELQFLMDSASAIIGIDNVNRIGIGKFLQILYLFFLQILLLESPTRFLSNFFVC